MDLKQCSKCKENKSIYEFNFKIKKLLLRQKSCRDCTRREIRKHYAENKQYYLNKARKRNGRIRTMIKNHIYEYFQTHPCVDCGEKDPIVLEFDHIDNKSFTISSVGRDKTMILVQREIDKCQVRCANCHRRKTAKQFGWHKKIMPL